MNIPLSEKQIHYIKGLAKGLRDSLLFHIFGMLPIQKNKIAVMNFHGKGYGDNPKYIIEELLQRSLQFNGKEKYKIVWFVNDYGLEFPEGVTKVANTVWSRAYHLSTAKVWIGNVRKPYGTRKRNNQLYIQTWHGPIGFKPVGALLNDFSSITYKARINDSNMADYFVSNSTWCSDMYRKAFYYTGNMLEVGSPRCDVLFGDKDNLYQKIRADYNIPNNASILVYAPTFRGGLDNTANTYQSGNYGMDFHKLIASLETRFGGSWYILLRLHPHLSKDINSFMVYQQYDRIKDISSEEDLYRILAVSDAMISDYSSVAFDAAYMRIPVFLYADDMERYEQERGSLLWDMHNLPFPFAGSEQELFDHIKNFDNERYLTELEELFQQVGLIEDGHASERVVDVIDEFIEKE